MPTPRDSYTLKIRQGEDFEKYFQWCLADGVTPVPLAGMVGRCQIRNGANNTGIIQTVTVKNMAAPGWGYKLSLTAAQTSAIPTTGIDFADVEIYTFDVEFTDSAGLIYRVLNGPVEISPEVTR